MKKTVLSLLCLAAMSVMAQPERFPIPVSEVHEKMQTGQYEPTWQSLQTHETPEWFRNAKFGIWPTGVLSAWKARATGWPASSIWRATASTSTT